MLLLLLLVLCTVMSVKVYGGVQDGETSSINVDAGLGDAGLCETMLGK